MAYWRNIIPILALALVHNGCDTSYVSSIPSLPVNIKLDLNGKYANMRNPNQFLLYDKRIEDADRIGFGGVIIYASANYDEYSRVIHYAYDMACPVEISTTARVFPIVTGFIGQAKCEKCGSVYDLSQGFGNPISGPSKEILRRYRVQQSQNFLYIY